MTEPIPESKLLRLSERDRWRAWLQKNYRSKDETWLVYAKKHTGEPRISYNDAVEEALCFGWIDSIVKTVDEGPLCPKIFRAEEHEQLVTVKHRAASTAG